MQTVKQILEDEFGTKVTTQGNVLKTTVKTINGNGIANLNDIYMSDSLGVDNIELKRSGTSITILVTLED
jgi:hypothetical protein